MTRLSAFHRNAKASLSEPQNIECPILTFTSGNYTYNYYDEVVGKFTYSEYIPQIDGSSVPSSQFLFPSHVKDHERHPPPAQEKLSSEQPPSAI